MFPTMPPARRSAARKYHPNAARGFRVDCVFLSCFASECQFFRNVLCCDGIRLHVADTLETADFLLTVTGSSVLISDVVFLDGSWRDALALVARVHPHAGFLVVADQVDRSFVSDAPDCGALGVLWKPFTIEDLRRWIQTAHEAAGERLLWCDG
jgi:DNA-binding NtrC family response regulator